MLPRPLIIASLLGASVGVPYIASQTRQGLGTPAAAPGVPHAATPQPNFSMPPMPTGSTPIGAAPPASTLVAPPLATPPPANSYGAASPAVTTASAITAPLPVSTTPAPPAATVPSTVAGPPVATVAAAYPVTAASAPNPQTGAQFTSVDQVLRFDVTKEWVLRNWPRTSTGPTDVGLLSMRVPLVMGTQMSSLVGALTYFFNDQGQVEHISFHGRTGDARPLEQLLVQRYQFQPTATATGEKLFQVRSGEAIFSEARLRPEAVIRSTTPQQSIVVDLEFARPGTKRVLPPHEPTLQLPPGAPPAQPAATAANNPAASASAANGTAPSSGYWDRVHYATPAEERQLQRMRWPQ